MGKLKELSHASSAQLVDPISGPSGDTPEEIHGLLVYLKTAVDDLRERLTSKRKAHYTVEEIADLVGRSPYTIRRWISEGRITAIRINGTGPKGRLLIARDQLDAIVADGLAAAIPDAVAGS